MVGQFFADKFQHLTSNASIVDLTLPSFSGITSAVANPNGSITASWSAATDSSTPINYLVYIQLGSVSAASLFVPTNEVLVAPSLATNIKVYTLADQITYLQAGQIYTLGVRAKDAVGNVNTNIAIATATSSGVLSDSLSSTVSQLVQTQSELDSNLATLDGYLNDLSASVTDVETASTKVTNAANLTMSIIL